MIWNLAIISFMLVVVGSIILAAFNISSAESSSKNTIENFLLANKNLNKNSIVNLLLSSSFGLNALFYAIWLGYTVGIWGLVIQAAWATSFILLTPYSNKLRSANSLHDFLGKKFGLTTKLFASICSLIGIMYLMGWEVGIGETAIIEFLKNSNALTPDNIDFKTSLLINGAIIGTLVYTIIGGLKGNAEVDKLLNFLKIVVLVTLTVLLVNRFFSDGNNSFLKALFPSLKSMKENLGIWGLVTNVVFNISWQFVDNSSWQSIIAGKENHSDQTIENLKLSSVTIFLTVGLLGTLIGVVLVGTNNINPNNVITYTVQLLPSYKNYLTFGIFLIIAACIMSLLDGLLLASGLTIILDILQLKANKNLFFLRFLLIVIAFLAIWGVKFIFYLTKANLFDFVYIVIITQLALFGPVIIGLATDRVSKKLMWISIVFALIVGFVSAFLGAKYELKFLFDGAGTFTLVTSLILSFLFSSEHSIK